MIIRTFNNVDSLLSQFMDDFSIVPFSRDYKKVANSMNTDVLENDKEFIMSIELAGFTKEQVKIEIDSGYLVVSAERENASCDENQKFIRKERTCKSVSRSFYVGDEIDEDGITAKMDNGVLQINLPKKTPVLPEKKLIDIH